MTNIRLHITETVKLAYPVSIGQLGIMMMGLIDAIMVGSIGAAPLAAASLASGLFLLIFIIGNGIALAATPLIAIAVGEENTAVCNKIFRNSYWVNLITGFILAGLTIYCSDLLRYLNQPKEVVELAITYNKILAVSLIPTSIFMSYKQFVEGLSFTKPAMCFSIAAVLVNVVINWFFIYGNCGAPKMGLNGAALGTFSARCFMAYGMKLYVNASKNYKSYDKRIFKNDLDFTIIKKILSLGLPSGMQYFFEVGAFTFAIIMVGWIGTTDIAAHQVAINLASISFMAALGLSTAGSIRVGNALGRKSIKEIRYAGFTAILLSTTIMSASGLTFILFNHTLPAFFIKDPIVIAKAASILIIAAMFQLSDGIQAVGIGVLRGILDVKGPTIITFFSYWILALPLGYYLAFNMHLNLMGIWIGLLVGLTSSATLLTTRFNIKSKRVLS
ncbi:MAG: MATE family efflux transporter [Bacteroidota bacterium]|nr:MATE family efflux transporter [Bacteroidota bacterium]